MPYCARCDTWYSPSQASIDCPVCGEALHASDALRRLEARLEALGLSIDDYPALRYTAERSARDQPDLAENEPHRRAEAAVEIEAQEGKLREWQLHRWNSDPAGSAQAYVFGNVFLVLPATVVLGIVLFAALFLLGRSPWAAIGGTLSGFGAALLVFLSYLGIGEAFDRLAPHSGLVRRYGEDVDHGLIFLSFMLPPALTLAVSFLLS